MEDLKSRWKSRLQEKWTKEKRSPGSTLEFALELATELESIIEEKHSNEEIMEWFAAIPHDYWKFSGENEFHIAALVENHDIVEYLISKGHTGINQKNYHKLTALCFAVENRNAKVVKALLDAGAIHDNTYYAEIGKGGPLHLAAKNPNRDSTDMIKLLLDAGADVNAVDSDKITPLLTVILLNRAQDADLVDKVKLLLDAGAEVNCVCEYFGVVPMTPLTEAINAHLFRVVALLLDAGANVNAVGPVLHSPLHCAASDATRADEEIAKLVKRLIAMGADVKALNSHGETPLDYAIMCGNPVAAKILIDSGASTKFSENPKFSPLHAAVKSECSELIDLLCKLKSDVDLLNWRQDHGDPGYEAKPYRELLPIQLAAVLGKPDTVAKLIKYGADVTYKHKHGYDMLFYATGGSAKVTRVEDQNDLADRRKTLRIVVRKLSEWNLESNVEYGTLNRFVTIADLDLVRGYISKCTGDITKPLERFQVLLEYVVQNREHGHSILKYLLKHVNPDAKVMIKIVKDKLLIKSIMFRNVDCIRYLVKLGADVNSTSHDITPLAAACRTTSRIVRLLLELNADVNARVRNLPLKEAIVNRVDVSRSSSLFPVKPAFGIMSDTVEEAGDIVRTLVRHIILEIAQEKIVTAENYRLFVEQEYLERFCVRCLKSIMSMKESLIHDSISCFDVIVNPKRYSRNQYVVKALENEETLKSFGEYRDLLIERFQGVRQTG